MNQDKGPRASHVGLRDVVLDGWLDMETGQLARGVKIRATDTVIDVGCGDGGYISFCARQGAEVIFIDRDQAKLAITEEKVKASPAHAYRAILSDCNPIDLEDGAGDVVICTEVLEHVDDPVKFIGELVRIARPGAQLLVTVPDARSEKLVGATAPAEYFEAPNHLRIFADGELRALLLDAGLEIEFEQSLGAFSGMYLALSWLTSESGEFLPMDNPHPITDNWTRLWKALQEHPKGALIRDAFNELLPRTRSIVARKPG
jgi:SAM-dependent methyltransferase